MNEIAQRAFDRMKADPIKVSIQEILLITEGFQEELKEIIPE